MTTQPLSKNNSHPLLVNHPKKKNLLPEIRTVADFNRIVEKETHLFFGLSDTLWAHISGVDLHVLKKLDEIRSLYKTLNLDAPKNELVKDLKGRLYELKTSHDSFKNIFSAVIKSLELFKQNYNLNPNVRDNLIESPEDIDQVIAVIKRQLTLLKITCFNKTGITDFPELMTAEDISISIARIKDNELIE